jgi:hypothetical protein
MLHHSKKTCARWGTRVCRRCGGDPKLDEPHNYEEIEMGTGFVSRFSLRTVRLILAGVLLATLFTVSGVTLSDGVVSLDPPAAFASEPGGSTGGG